MEKRTVCRRRWKKYFPWSFRHRKVAILLVECGMCLLLFVVFLSERGGVFPTNAQAGKAWEEETKKVAITFDDGPHPIYTKQLLDGLDERGVKATFFVTGINAERYPEIIREISRQGHLIGNHTYYHTQLTGGNLETFKEEIFKTNELLKELTGEEILYIRPPYGSWNKAVEKDLNMFPVLWSVDPLDWCSTSVSCIVQSVMAKVRENDVILLHDHYPSTVTAALKIVDKLTAQGYRFVTVDEILFD
ncbi:MAG: polysaccharide deacetylase family protein [Clostridium sp.]|nr:polysaccharide deacetylase family protein [Clostridium sp.]